MVEVSDAAQFRKISTVNCSAGTAWIHLSLGAGELNTEYKQANVRIL